MGFVVGNFLVEPSLPSYQVTNLAPELKGFFTVEYSIKSGLLDFVE